MKPARDFLLSFLLSVAITAQGAAMFAQAVTDPSEKENGNGKDDWASTNVSTRTAEEQEPKGSQSTGGNVLKGQVNYTVPSGTPLKLKLATVPTYTLKMMERDLDGNLLPAKLGQEITAKVTEDLYVDNNKVIPEGTVFHGRVSKVLPPRRVGRPGSLLLSFDRIITPDGRKFAFRADADNFKPSTVKSKAKGFGIISAHAAAGAFIGAMVAYEICGLHETIAMHGYNVAGGAAAGALLATGFAIMRHGPQATLEPGDDLNMRIDSDLLMPAAVDVRVKKPANTITGLDLKVEKSKLVGDGLGGHLLTMDAVVANNTDRKLSSIDLYVEDTNGNRAPLCSNEDDNSEILFTVEPHSRQHLHMAFLIPYPKLKRQIVWLEHEDKTVCFRQALR